MIDDDTTLAPTISPQAITTREIRACLQNRRAE
jgi:hypothetical protein